MPPRQIAIGLMQPNTEQNKKSPIGAVLVQGGGIAGVQASLDLANSGFKVYLVERDAAIGGMMSHLDKTFPTGDCATCIVSPKLVECARNLNIEILTLSELVDLKGDPGRRITTATIQDGAPGEFIVNDTLAGNQQNPDVAMSLSGDTYVVTCRRQPLCESTERPDDSAVQGWRS